MGNKVQSVISQDLNEDGFFDLAAVNQNSNSLAILLNQCN
jgi:hypothetical protein